VTGSSPLLATPTSWLGRRPSHAEGRAERWHNPERSNELSDQIATLALLPTPTNQDGSNVAGASQERRNSPPLNALVRLLPTPDASVANYAEDPQEWQQARADILEEKHRNGNGHGTPLAIAVKLLPTPHGMPKEGQARRPGPSGNELGRALSNGASTSPRSADGNTSTGQFPIRLWSGFVEWMLGAPQGWSDPDCLLSATEFKSKSATSSGRI
jgi:hypothetical protein